MKTEKNNAFPTEENLHSFTPTQWRRHQRKHRLVVFLSVILSAIVTLGAVFAVFFTGRLGSVTKKLFEVDALLRRDYLGNIKQEAVDNAIFSSYLQAIGDDYSFYQNAKEAKAVADSFEGNARGIGVTVVDAKEQKALRVIRVDPSGPAAQAGMQINDLIFAVDGKKVSELGYQKSVNAIRREVNETVSLQIIRNKKTETVTMRYAEFIGQTVYTEQIGRIGYLCFTAFNEATVEQFDKAMEDFKEAGVTALLFDVRDNGGGTVDSVCAVLDRLVGRCNLMTVREKGGKKTVTHTSDEVEVDYPMAVLVNGHTASAAELFAATLRDCKKALLIGNTTFGKGVMQRTYFLSDGSCIRFTVGEFFSAGGRSFHKKGLTPDREITLPEGAKVDSFVISKDPYVKKGLEILS